MEETLFVRLSESKSTGYVTVEKVFFNKQKIEEEYYRVIEEMGVSNPILLKTGRRNITKLKFLMTVEKAI